MNFVRSLQKQIVIFPRMAVTNNSTNRFIQTQTTTLDPVQDRAMNEMCITTNENDEATGYASKRDCHLVKNNNDVLLHRAFSIFLFNSKNELLLQKRSASKITFPNCVTNTCCSHPLYEIEQERETEDAAGIKLAARRRLNIELGIPPEEIDLDSIQYVKRIHYKSLGDGIWGEHEIDYILVLHKDVTLNPNPDEISELCYVSKQEIKSYLKDKTLTPWFKACVYSNWIDYWWDNLHQLSKIADVKEIHRFGTI